MIFKKNKTLKIILSVAPILLLSSCYEGTPETVSVYSLGKQYCPLSSDVYYNIFKIKNGKESNLGKILVRENKGGKCTLVNAQGFNYETSNIVTRFLLASFRKIGDDKTYLTAETNLKTNNNSLIFVKVSTNGKIAFYTDCRKKSAFSIVDKLGISRNNDTCTLSERSQYYELAYEISNTEPDVVLTPVKP